MDSNNVTTNAIYGRGERTENTTNCVKWNQAGTKLLTGGRDNTVRLYDAAEGQTVRSIQDYRQHTGSITCLAFDSPENEHIFASTSKDNSFRVWDTRKPKQPVHVERTKEEIIRGIFSPGQAVGGENIFATCNYLEEINFYDTRMWRLVKQIKYKQEVESFIWDRSGAAFFVADVLGNISVYNGETLKPTPEVTLSGVHRKGSRCTSIAMHPSNTFFATAGNDAIIAFWDFEEFLCMGTILENQHSVRNLSFSSCGAYLAAICQDDRVETEKKFLLEVYDSEQRVQIALPPTNISHQSKTSLDWHPSKLVLALSGHNENSQGIVHLLQLEPNNPATN